MFHSFVHYRGFTPHTQEKMLHYTKQAPTMTSELVSQLDSKISTEAQSGPHGPWPASQ